MMPSMGTEYSANVAEDMFSMAAPAACTDELMSVCMYWNRMGIRDKNIT